MKRIFYVICATFIVLISQSCGNNSSNPQLVAIDSLISQNPDSACKLLAAYPADLLTKDEDRAYYALLVTIADYKAYHPATTDSIINIAVNHYDHNGANQDHRMRSLLYKGCVMEELGNDKEAMRYYKHAQYACPDNDAFHKGYIFFRIATIYHFKSELTQSILNYKYACNLLAFNKTSIYYRDCIKHIGALYRDSDNDSAIKYIELGISLSRMAGDETGVTNGTVDKVGYYYNIEDYPRAKNLAHRILDSEAKKLLTDVYLYYFACMSYTKMNMLDSAQIVLDMMPPLQDAVDSMQYYRCKAEIQKKQNILNADYNKNLGIAETLEDSLIQTPIDNGLVSVEREVDREHTAQQTHKWMIISLACILFIILVAAYYYHSQKRYQRLSAQLRDEVTRLNDEITQSLVKVETLKEQGTGDSQKVNDILETIDASLMCYSSIISKYIDRASINSGLKNEKVVRYMDDEFFGKLRRFVNLRYDNLIEKLQSPDFDFSKDELNIICLDLCKFPPSVVWTYSRFDRLHSIFNKKSKIAAKFGCKSISEIPEKFK